MKDNYNNIMNIILACDYIFLANTNNNIPTDNKTQCRRLDAHFPSLTELNTLNIDYAWPTSDMNTVKENYMT